MTALLMTSTEYKTHPQSSPSWLLILTPNTPDMNNGWSKLHSLHFIQFITPTSPPPSHVSTRTCNIIMNA